MRGQAELQVFALLSTRRRASRCPRAQGRLAMHIQARRRSAGGLALAALALWLAAPAPVRAADAQGYPNRPVRIVVPAAAGGALDIIARLMAQKIGENWKQQLYIDN